MGGGRSAVSEEESMAVSLVQRRRLGRKNLRGWVSEMERTIGWKRDKETKMEMKKETGITMNSTWQSRPRFIRPATAVQLHLGDISKPQPDSSAVSIRMAGPNPIDQNP
jgi:hypothetical protein